MIQPGFLSASLLVAGGGALGAWLRFLVGRVVLDVAGPAVASAFPWATLSVNVAGSLLMGLLVGWLAHGQVATALHAEALRLLLGVGVLGGFTTFSSFSLEFALLVERGAFALAAGYVALSLVAGFAGLFFGLALTRVPA